MINKIPYNSHDEWLAIRNKYIGGSDAGTVLGFDTYKSPYTLWAEKTGRIEAFSGNIITQVGSYLEEFVAKLFTEQTEKKVRRQNATVVNDKYSFACANVDRLIVGEPALLEIKTTNSFPIMRRCKNGEFPEKWYCQMMHYMAVTELKKAYLAVLINCREFKVFELERDESEIEALMAAEAEFWQYMQNDTPPAVDGTESTTDAVNKIYPQAIDKDVIDMTGCSGDIAEYIALKQQEKAIQQLIDKCSNNIKEHMGNAEKGTVGQYTVSWTNMARKTFDTKRFKEENRNIDLDKYYKSTEYRQFKITQVEG